MTRPPTLNPLGIPEAPNLAHDPARIEEIRSKFVRRMQLLERSYRSASQVSAAQRATFNQSLARLKRHLARIDRGENVPVEQTPETRLHLELELLINLKARALAGLDASAPLESKHKPHVEAAAVEVAASIRAKRGRPSGYLLQYCVAALISAYIEATGKPVVGQRTKNSDYAPNLDSPSGQIIRTFVDRVEPRVADTTLVNMVRRIRRQYAGKTMQFEDFFPLDAGPQDGGPKALPGYQIDAFIPIQPIYCP